MCRHLRPGSTGVRAIAWSERDYGKVERRVWPRSRYTRRDAEKFVYGVRTSAARADTQTPSRSRTSPPVREVMKDVPRRNCQKGRRKQALRSGGCRLTAIGVAP